MRGVLTTAWVAAAIAALALVAGGCGSSEPAPTILDTEKVERAIETSSVAQRGTRPRVSCPAGVHQKKGLTFSCTARHGATATRFVVSQVDAAGNVRYVAP